MFQAIGDCHFHFIDDENREKLELIFAKAIGVNSRNEVIWEIPTWMHRLSSDRDCVFPSN